jgi:hypothetical protein
MKSLTSIALSTLLLWLLSGCAGSGNVRVTEGSEQIGRAPTGSVYITNEAIIVHVDEIERLATLRNARNFEAGVFLQTTDREGNKNAILKTRENREVGLRTADILEGEPKINDHATPVTAAEATRLQKIYREPAG